MGANLHLINPCFVLVVRILALVNSNRTSLAT